MDKYFSPMMLLVPSFGLFLIAFFFPPSLYQSIIYEQNKAALNITSLTYWSIFLAVYCLGVKLGSSVVQVPSSHKIEADKLSANKTVIALTGLLFGSVNLYSVYSNIGSMPFLIQILISQSGYQIKSGDEFSFSGDLVNIFVLSFLILVFKILVDLRYQKKRFRESWLVYLSFIIMLMSFIASCSIRLTRGEFMPGFFAIALILSSTMQPNIRRLVIFALWFLILIVAIFILFSAARGVIDGEKILSDLVAYSLSSFNRLAHLLEGDLKYTYGGNYMYFSGFVSFNQMFHSLTNIDAYFGWPSFYAAWQQEFSDVASAGLNSDIIWATLPGYVFIDFGWFGAPIVALLYGLVAGFFWSLWRRRTVLGIACYPWCAFSTFFWFGTNYVLDTKFAVCFLVGLFVLGLCSVNLTPRVRIS